MLKSSWFIDGLLVQPLDFFLSLHGLIVTFCLCHLSLSELHSTRPALSPALAAHQPVRRHAAMMSSYDWQWSCQHVNRKKRNSDRNERKMSFSASYSCHLWKSDRNLSKQKIKGQESICINSLLRTTILSFPMFTLSSSSSLFEP